VPVLRAEIAARQKHLQPFGIVHGGVFASLLDATAFWAAYSQAPEDVGMTTVDLKLNYLAPLLSEASIRNEEGALLAHGTSLPGKFLD